MAERDSNASTPGWTRADWARWFIERDEVDEAARVLEPGDQLELGHSDYLGLAAALGRRGLGARYEGRQVRVEARPEGRTAPMAGELSNGSRRPPVRQTPPAGTAPAKKLG
jgi:hypothetical protein